MLLGITYPQKLAEPVNTNVKSSAAAHEASRHTWRYLNATALPLKCISARSTPTPSMR